MSSQRMPWLSDSTAPWARVRAGDVVQDKNGTAWDVERITPRAAMLDVELAREADGRVTRAKVTVPPNGTVLLLLSREVARELGVARAKITLGAREVAVPTQGGQGYACPSSWDDVSSLLAHLFLLHGRVMAADSLSYLVGQHADLHARGEVSEPHIHTPRYLEGRA